MQVESCLGEVGHATEICVQAVRIGNGKIEVTSVARQNEPKVVRSAVEIGQILPAAGLPMRTEGSQQKESCQDRVQEGESLHWWSKLRYLNVDSPQM